MADPTPQAPNGPPAWQAPFDAIGVAVLQVLSDLGGMAMLAATVAMLAFRRPFRPYNLLLACEQIGVGSLFVVVLTGFFTGAVFGMQSALAFSIFDAESLVGATVALSLTRELAPVLTGLMVTGRAGSAIATELGSMRVTEQIDALATMAVDPRQYLLVPRVIAGVLVAPFLCMIFDLVGVFGSYLVSVHLQGISEAGFWARISSMVELSDVLGGLVKAAVFGGIISLAACHKGFHAEGGARGVGVATTEAVVLSSVTILVADYFLTVILIPFWSA